MWFRFPPGVDNISVQQQNFRSEAEDKEGGKFFRAPDHFAPIILDLPGFSRVVTPPSGAPADLPKEDPEASRALGNLATQVDALKTEIVGLKAELASVTEERDSLVAELKGLKIVGEEAKPKSGPTVPGTASR